jgi:hypothetical protein
VGAHEPPSAKRDPALEQGDRLARVLACFALALACVVMTANAWTVTDSVRFARPDGVPELVIGSALCATACAIVLGGAGLRSLGVTAIPRGLLWTAGACALLTSAFVLVWCGSIAAM